MRACVHVRECDVFVSASTHAAAQVWRREGNVQESALTFHRLLDWRQDSTTISALPSCAPGQLAHECLSAWLPCVHPILLQECWGYNCPLLYLAIYMDFRDLNLDNQAYVVSPFLMST